MQPKEFQFLFCPTDLTIANLNLFGKRFSKEDILLKHLYQIHNTILFQYCVHADNCTMTKQFHIFKGGPSYLKKKY